MGIVALLVAARQPALVPPPSEADARRFFDRVVELAQAGDFER